jgi:hypothetical protein
MREFNEHGNLLFLRHREFVARGERIAKTNSRYQVETDSKSFKKEHH